MTTDNTHKSTQAQLDLLFDSMEEGDTDLIRDNGGEEIISYAEILAAVLLNDEIILTIPMESEERVKNGIKNYKSKQAAKLRAEGQPFDASTLTFSSIPSKDFYGYVDLTVMSKNRGVIKIKQMRIPENDLPS